MSLLLQSQRIIPVAPSAPPRRRRLVFARAASKTSLAGFTVWEDPSTSNNVVAETFASSSPVDGLGAITGFWFLDVFVAMNVVLVLALLIGSMLVEENVVGDKEDESGGGD